MGWVRRAVFVGLIVVGLSGLIGAHLVGAQATKQVFVIQVHGVIDLGLSPYVKRVLGEAEEQGASAIVLDINTPGGRLDSALEIKDALLGSAVPVTAFINREAFSAGALIAIAAHTIYMTPGAALGAATPIDQTGEKASEKVVSAVRTAFRSTAEARDRDPDIAEAMVDESVVVEGLVEEGKLLTLTTDEAVELGFVDGEVEDLGELLEALELTGAAIVRTSPSWSETLVRIITNPALASLFISIGFLGLFVELTSPGFGVPGIAGIALLALFFWGHFLAGLAGWEGLILVLVGLGLIALEIFVVPGFGVAGILGIGAFLGGLFLSLIGQGAGLPDFTRAGLILLGSFAIMAVGVWLVIVYLPRGRLFRGLALQTFLAAGPGLRDEPAPTPVDPPESAEESSPRAGAGSLKGARGYAITELHPSGIAEIDKQRVDVVTEGDFVAPGMEIEVISDEGYRRVVRALEAQPPTSSEESRTENPPTID
jgi:membrane-bound serine protease (ClpP class)